MTSQKNMHNIELDDKNSTSHKIMLATRLKKRKCRNFEKMKPFNDTWQKQADRGRQDRLRDRQRERDGLS